MKHERKVKIATEIPHIFQPFYLLMFQPQRLFRLKII